MENEHQLPITAEREGENELVGSAAQAFFTGPMSAKTPGWISGHVKLPAKSIKDAEGVGSCCQVVRKSQRRLQKDTAAWKKGCIHAPRPRVKVGPA